VFQEPGTQVLTYLLHDGWGTVIEASLIVPVGNISIASVTPSVVRTDGRFGQTVASVTISLGGTGFAGGAELIVGGRSFKSPDIVVVSDERIFLTLPIDPTGQAGLAPGIHDIELRTSESTSTLPNSLTVEEAPHFDLVGRTVNLAIGPNGTDPRKLPMYQETPLVTLDFRNGTVQGSFQQSTGEGLINSTEESDSTRNYMSEIFAKLNNSLITFTSGTLPDGTPLTRLEPNSPLFSNVMASGVQSVSLRLVLTPAGGSPDSSGDTLLIQTSGSLEIVEWDAASEKLRGTLTLREAPASGQVFSTGSVILRYQVEFDFSAEQMALVQGTAATP